MPATPALHHQPYRTAHCQREEPALLHAGARPARPGQSIPDDAGSQYVVPRDHMIERRHERIETRTGGKAQNDRCDVGVAVDTETVMKQDTLLQGCQWIDILNIGRTSGHLGGDGVDIRLGEFHQGQHLWCDRLAFFRNQIVGAPTISGSVSAAIPSPAHSHLVP